MPLSAIAFIFIGCSSPSIITGTVTDIWGNPIADAPISKLSNIFSADKTTNENGEFDFLSYNGAHTLFVDPDGYVPQEIKFEHLSEDGIDPDPLEIQLYPVPPERGIFAVGEERYLELDEQISTKVGTDIKALQGIQDIGGTNIGKVDTIDFVFYIGEDLIMEQILQMKLQLHEMMFVNKGEKFLTIKGYATPFIGLWVTKEYNNEKIKSYDVKLNIELIEREQTFLIDLLQTGKEFK